MLWVLLRMSTHNIHFSREVYGEFKKKSFRLCQLSSNTQLTGFTVIDRVATGQGKVKGI